MNNEFIKCDLTGKSAVVTGGGTGLGCYLARSGAKVMLASRREAVLHDAAERLTAESDGNQVLYHAVDLADRANTSAFVAHAISALGGWGEEAKGTGLAQFIASDTGSYLTSSNRELTITLRPVPAPESPVISKGSKSFNRIFSERWLHSTFRLDHLLFKRSTTRL